MCLLVVGALVLFWRLVELLYLIFPPSLVFIKSLHAIVISFTKTFDDGVNTAFGMGHIFLWRNNATNWNMSPIQEWRVHTLQQNITAIGLTYIYWVILLNINEHTVYVAAGFLPTIVYVVTFPSLFFLLQFWISNFFDKKRCRVPLENKRFVEMTILFHKKKV